MRHRVIQWLLLLVPIGRKKTIPDSFRNMKLRRGIFAALMGLMVFRILQDLSNPMHWGQVFWLMCVITTGVGVIQGIAVHARAWGTLSVPLAPYGRTLLAGGSISQRLIRKPAKNAGSARRHVLSICLLSSTRTWGEWESAITSSALSALAYIPLRV